jgi:hypothetical protein
MTEMNTIPVYVLIGVYDDRSITTSFAFTNFDTAKKISGSFKAGVSS